jgi:hypothetical protein
MATLVHELFSQNVWSGPFGSQTVWNFTMAGGYISRSHVKAYYILSGTTTKVPVALGDSNFLGTYQIQIPALPSTAVEFGIYRDTPKDQPIVNFQDGGNVSEVSLDQQAEQSVFVAQEAFDQSQMASFRADDATSGSQAAIVNAENALAVANAAQVTANTANTSANAAVSTANTANSNVNTAITTANAANSAATAAASQATTAAAQAAAAAQTASDLAASVGNPYSKNGGPITGSATISGTLGVTGKGTFSSGVGTDMIDYPASGILRWRTKYESDGTWQVQRYDASGNYQTTPISVAQATGFIGLVGGVGTGQMCRLSGSITGAVSAYGHVVSAQVQSDVTTQAVGFSSHITPADQSYTLAGMVHFRAAPNPKGASATVTNQYGFLAESSLGGVAANNYGFYGNLSLAVGNWNLYMGGSADNFLAGSLGVGRTPACRLDVQSSGALTARFNNSQAGAAGQVAVTSNDRSMTITQRSSTHASGEQAIIDVPSTSPLVLTVSGTEKARLTTGGVLCVGYTADQAAGVSANFKDGIYMPAQVGVTGLVANAKTDKFTYAGCDVHNYGIAWKPFTDTTAWGPTAALSGYGGIRMFSQGVLVYEHLPDGSGHKKYGPVQLIDNNLILRGVAGNTNVNTQSIFSCPASQTGSTAYTVMRHGTRGTASVSYDGSWLWTHREGNGSVFRQGYVLALWGYDTGSNSWSGEMFTFDGNGNFFATGNITAYSDERRKTNWRKVQDGFVEKLAGIEKAGIYDRVDSPITQVGIGAQSLRKVLPEAVTEGDDGDLRVAYGNAAMVSVVELAKYATALEARLAKAEAMIAQLMEARQ